MDLAALKEECKEEMFIYGDVGLKLIEIIEQKNKQIQELESEIAVLKNVNNSI